jgi:hypothetical protein
MVGILGGQGFDSSSAAFKSAARPLAAVTCVNVNLVRRDGGVHGCCGDSAVSNKPIIKESELKRNEAGTITIATILGSEHNSIFWQRVANAF